MQNRIQLYRDKYRNFRYSLRVAGSKLKRQFKRPPFPELESKEINLHLGCGSINHSKFINIDVIPEPHIHYIRSIDRLSPFSNESVDLIYASHCLEHFPHQQVPKVIREWFRVLKKDGLLRLSVPNFETILKIYYDNDKHCHKIIPYLMGAQNHEYNFHYTIFNYCSLKDILFQSGFSEVRVWQPNTCEYTTFHDTSALEISLNQVTYYISLNIEAIK